MLPGFDRCKEGTPERLVAGMSSAIQSVSCVMIWVSVLWDSMGTMGSRQHEGESWGYQDSGDDYYVPAKEDQDRGFRKGQEIFWRYLGMKLSGPLDLKGMHRFMLIENKNGRYKEELRSIRRP